LRVEFAPVESLASFSWKLEMSPKLALGDSEGDEAFDTPPNTRRKKPGRAVIGVLIGAAEVLILAVIVVVVLVAIGSG
jgi:hypothetical protein